MSLTMPIKRKYNAPDFLDWLFEQDVYNVAWDDDDDPDDDTLVINYEGSAYSIENLFFRVWQDEMSLTIEIIDAQPDNYDDFWTGVIDLFHSELPTQLSGEKLSPLNVTLEYTFDFSALKSLSDKK